MNRNWLVLSVSIIIAGLIIGGVGAPTQGAPTRTPIQVEVVNFPDPQRVAGDVSVINLPLDADGRIRVSGMAPVSPASIRVVGLTLPSPQLAIVDLSNVCAMEFPGTRICEESEVFRSLPPPGFPIPFVWVFRDRQGVNDGVSLTCTTGFGGNFSSVCGNNSPMPVVCCGF